MPLMRLDKLLSQLGLATRSESRAICMSGRVRVNGSPPRTYSEKVNTDLDSITLDGKTLIYKQTRVFMMNKPEGVVSARTDGRDLTALDIMDETCRRLGLFPAGRLDKRTTGLLLMTNDGDLTHNIIMPSSGIVKKYSAKLLSPLPINAERLFAEGIVLSDGTRFKPALAEAADSTRMNVYVSVTEGKYHQVRRMLKSVGSPVTDLKRLSIGGLVLDPALSPGEYRELDEQEISRIFEK